MKLEIRNRILQVALERFNEDGFKVVTTESLSKDIGISKRTLYAYFNSKEDIFETIYSEKNELERAAFDIIFENISQNVGNRFLDEIKGLATINSKLKNRYSKLFFRDLKIYFPHLWQIELDLRAGYSRKGFDIIWQKGISEGLFKANIPKEIVYLMQTEVFNKMLDPEVLQNLSGSIDEVVATVTEIFLFGVADSDKLRTQN